ncbi:hypothetical protein [Fortiea contorta]|uniref:hypothetical protein n=1 Tax=Fortiea contorta TaxID=1892405 RepID=UPI00034D1465
MFGISELKQTRVYQEAREEGKQEGLVEGKQEGLVEGLQKAKLAAIPKLLLLGLTVEQIAQALDLDIAQVHQLAQQQRSL